MKLRAIADHGGPLCIGGNIISGFSVIQDKKKRTPPSVELHGEAVARSERDKKKGRRKRKRGKGDEEEEGTTMRCDGTVLEHVCVALPRDLWVELMALGWGLE